MSYMKIAKGAIVRLALDKNDDRVTNGMLAHNGEEFVIKSVRNTQIRLAGFKSKYGVPYVVTKDMLEMADY